MFSQNVNSADGVFWMYYVGISEEKKALGSQAASCLPLMRPGLAMSQVGYVHGRRILPQLYSSRMATTGHVSKGNITLDLSSKSEKRMNGMRCSSVVLKY